MWSSLVVTPAWAYHYQDLASWSLEELMNIDVRLVSRHSQSLQEAPAAVYVLDHEDIQRSGANSIPELLRLVPGVEVARFGSGKWAVAIRGLNGIFTNRLLVLVDGRSVFSQAKVGMFWDTLDTLIEDIDHIEVVRGPGTALWGGDAFNGVINIVTRNAHDTQGGLFVVGGGDEEKWFSAIRYGAAMAGGYVRAYLKAFERDDASRRFGGENHDGWQEQQAGLRFDRGDSAAGALTVIIEADQGEEGESIFIDSVSAPGFVVLAEKTIQYDNASALARWQKRSRDVGEFSLQGYVSQSSRESVLLDIEIDTYDLDFQHDFQFRPQQRLIWGLGYRLVRDNLRPQFITFNPRHRDYELFSGFAQYEYDLPELDLRLTLGARLEHNDFTGEEGQPNVRLLWTPNKRNSGWAAISRAYRTPSRSEHDTSTPVTIVDIGGGQLLQYSIEGNRDFEAERLTAYELGWRSQLLTWMSLDLAVFFNNYAGLRTLEPGPPQAQSSPPPDFLVPVHPQNGADAESWGGELVLNTKLRPDWRLELSYSHLQLDIEPDNGLDSSVEELEGASPQHRVLLRSQWDVTRELEFNANLRYVDKLDARSIDAYTELDVQLSKHIDANWVVSLVGRNLLDKNHEEFLDLQVITPRVEVERGVYFKIQGTF